MRTPPYPARDGRPRSLLRRGLRNLTATAALVAGATALLAGAAVPPAASPVTASPGGVAPANPCGAAESVITERGMVCVHGDDTEFRVAATETAGSATLPALPIPCRGDGSSGNRIALLYGYFGAHADDLARARRRIRTAIEQANDIVYQSARQTAGRRWLRVLTTPSCTPIVRAVHLPAAARTDFGATVAALEKAGLDASDRKYVLFADTAYYCGLGTLIYDDQPGVMNANNAGPSWARVDSECWSGPATAHEIMHMLGSVQLSAPHEDGTGHCTDDHDLMCYPGAGGKPVYIRCRRPVLEQRLDCGKDDYFNTDPRSGSYLARHWDTARSSFLYGGGPERPVPPAAVRSVSATMPSLTGARVQWAPPARSRVTRYEVEKDGAVVWRGAGTSWTDPGARPGQGAYQVRAVNEAGAGPWSPPLDAVLPPPPAPASVTASGTAVAWTADSAIVAGYLLYGLPAGSTPRYLGAWPASARTATDPTPALFRNWTRYRVCAENAVGTVCLDQQGS